MIETKEAIGEPVKVIVSFSPGKIRLHFFEWQSRTYRVESMNLFHIAKDADKHLYHFSVSSDGNSYELVFDPTTLTWQLEEVVSA